MVSKTPRTRSKTMLHIMEGGERTYIHPYSFYPGYSDSNRIHLLRTDQFPPDQEGLIDWSMKYEVGLLKRGFSLVRRIWGFLKLQNKTGWFMVESSHLWNSLTPVYCAELYSGPPISVPGTLIPSMAGSRVTDTDYLIPSQEWIKKKLKAWLSLPVSPNEPNAVLVTKASPFEGINLPTWISFHEYARNSYLTWAKEQVKLGRKIGFLTSLDT